MLTHAMLQGIRAAITGFILPHRQVTPIRTCFRGFLLARHLRGLRPLLLIISIGWANLDKYLGALTLLNPLASACTVPEKWRCMSSNGFVRKLTSSTAPSQSSNILSNSSDTHAFSFQTPHDIHTAFEVDT